jgi:hypothetical protein
MKANVRACVAYVAGSLISGKSHYGNSHHVSLTIQGNTFTGYDHGNSQHFSGTVNAGSISLYDYETGSHFNYSV